jgi:hypothetical protein
LRYQQERLTIALNNLNNLNKEGRKAGKDGSDSIPDFQSSSSITLHSMVYE